eukprot:1177136-Prorocentrum_minimum.AAC.1
MGLLRLLTVLVVINFSTSDEGPACDESHQPPLAGACRDCTVGPSPGLVIDSHVEVLDFGVPGFGGEAFPCESDFGASDIIFHQGLGKLIIVSDEGQVAVVSLDGKKVQCFSPVPDDIKR